MGAKRRFNVPMGVYPSKSYVDVSAEGWSETAEARKVPMPGRYWNVGFQKKEFDDFLSSITLNLWAGTEGTITIEAKVSYRYFDWKKEILPSMVPHEYEGTVTCRGIWYYKCSPAGGLAPPP